MKYFKLQLIFLICYSSFSLCAQNNDLVISEIRTYYYALKATMKASSSAEYPRYYVVRLEENVDKVSMPAVGNYYGTEEFWYLPDAEKGTYGKDGTLIYRKTKYQIAAREEWIEYVFKEGELVFCFIKITGGEEYRFYFRNGSLIKYLGVEEEGAFYRKEDWKYILKNAKL